MGGTILAEFNKKHKFASWYVTNCSFQLQHIYGLRLEMRIFLNIKVLDSICKFTQVSTNLYALLVITVSCSTVLVIPLFLKRPSLRSRVLAIGSQGRIDKTLK